MYQDYFGLKELPFSISPDPKYLFMSQRHKEALAHLAYGISNGAGFVLLTGEVGTGKTTICRQVIHKLPENNELAFVLNPMLSTEELLASICDELGVEYETSRYSLKELTDNLTQHLLKRHAEGINVVLMIDEAQNLAPEVLEQIRLLTNLETDKKKLLQIILVGQPELQELLARKELRQLAQRITARYHLRPLNKTETGDYIKHRLRIAGSRTALFSRQAVEKVYALTEGVPRLINTLCDRALLAAYNADKRLINEAMINAAGNEVIFSVSASGQTSAEKKALIQQVSDNPIMKQLKVPALLFFGLLMVFLLWDVFISGDTENQESLSDKQWGQSNVEEDRRLSYKETDDEKADGEKTINKNVTSLRWGSRAELIQHILEKDIPDYSGKDTSKLLAKRWELNDFNPWIDDDLCEYAKSYNLVCHSGMITLNDLKDLNRPAMIVVEDHSGRKSWLMLQNIEDKWAHIETLSGIRKINIEWLMMVWTREFVLLWKAPPGFDQTIKLGDKGESVNWLAERLAFVYTDDGIKNKTKFDDELKSMLSDFQASRRLKPDGIAGMNTLIQLNTLTIKGIPKLVL